MRKIKFRAWHETKTKGNKMLQWDDLSSQPDLWHMLNNAYNNVTLMQFTGLRDKNGKEIYEGDILRRKSNHTEQTYFYKALWDAENARFMAIGQSIQELLSQAIERGYELGGNIYENPELLERSESK